MKIFMGLKKSSEYLKKKIKNLENLRVKRKMKKSKKEFFLTFLKHAQNRLYIDN